MSHAIPASTNPANQNNGGCIVLFGLTFVVVGLVVGALAYFQPIYSWWSSRSWVEVPCWIETAELKASSGGKGGATYRAVASYRYEFDGRSFHGDVVSFFGGSDNVGRYQAQAYQQLQAFEGKDRPFRCFVNPSKPEQAVLFRDLRWRLLLVLSLFPTMFSLGGFMVSIYGLVESRKADLNQKLAAQHLGEPWRWRPEWAGNSIQVTSDNLHLILAAAGWILVVQLPLALAVLLGGELAKSKEAGFALLPILLALLPIWMAWRCAQSRRALGHPTLQLKQLPVKPGSLLEGDLHLDRALSPMSSISARVLCQRPTTRGRGNSRTNAKETVWEHTEHLSAAQARRDISGVILPLRCEIPSGLPATVVDQASANQAGAEQHVWTLEISSSQGGKPMVMPLPVFAVNDAAKDAPNVADSIAKESVVTAALSSEDLASQLQVHGIRAEFDSNGFPTVLDCWAGRNRPLRSFLLLGVAILTAAFVIMYYQHRELILPLILAIGGVRMMGKPLLTLLYSRRVEIMAGELRIVNRIGPFYSWRETFEPRHFTGFTHDTHMKLGDQFYYRVRAETIFDKRKTLIEGITEPITAKALVQRLEEWRKRGLT